MELLQMISILSLVLSILFCVSVVVTKLKLGKSMYDESPPYQGVVFKDGSRGVESYESPSFSSYTRTL